MNYKEKYLKYKRKYLDLKENHIIKKYISLKDIKGGSKNNDSSSDDSSSNTKPLSINIDVGNVAIRIGYEADHGETELEFDPSKDLMDGFLENIAKLKKMGHTLYFNSFCGPEREKKTREIFRKIPEVYKIIPESNWNFVRTRPDKTKVIDATNADVMIDDRLDICLNMKEHGVKYIFWLTQSGKPSPAGIIKVKNWDEIYRKIERIVYVVVF